tara:strand:+ start:220 stop:612 length:393 start_codon:yes stop_codon:yes gene_type:complete
MYAIVNIAGKQYKVSKGDTIQTPTLHSKKGDKLIFDKVLATDDGGKITLGKPFLKDTTVNAKLLDHGRTRKILVYKKKRRKGYERKNTHRQEFTTIKIEKIITKKTIKKNAEATTKKKVATKKVSKTKED